MARTVMLGTLAGGLKDVQLLLAHSTYRKTPYTFMAFITGTAF